MEAKLGIESQKQHESKIEEFADLWKEREIELERDNH
jgi:hypothetical protein